MSYAAGPLLVPHSVDMTRFREREEERLWRRPHFDPKLASLGVVMPSADEARGAQRALSYAISSGWRLPQVRFLWAKDLKFIYGTTPRHPTPGGPAVVLLATPRSFEETFETVVHELDHVKRVYGGAVWCTDEELDRLAVAAVEQARRERWRW
jgi:hypothetical protein